MAEKNAIEVVAVFKCEFSDDEADRPGSGDEALNALWAHLEQTLQLTPNWENYQRQLTVKVGGRVDSRFGYKKPAGW